MEEISHLVSASFARYGFATQVDHRRLQWSEWSRCESSFSVFDVPCKPGLFAIAEEIPDGTSIHNDHRTNDCRNNDCRTNDHRTLAVLDISETEDLAMTLCRLFLPGAPQRELLAKKQCYARYAVIEDDGQRHASYRSLQESMATPTASTGLPGNLTVHTFAKEHEATVGSANSFPLAQTGS